MECVQPVRRASAAAPSGAPASASRAAFWRAPMRAPSASAASPAGVIAARSERFGRSAPARAGARAGRKHEREPACRRGDVLAPHPEPERDERLRHVGLQRGDRLGEPLGRQLALVGHVHDHAQQPPAPERHHEHAAHPHVLERAGQPVVERPTQAARRGEWLDLGDHTPEATGRPGRRPAQAAAARAASCCSRSITRSRASTHAGSKPVPDCLLSSSSALSSVQAGR